MAESSPIFSKARSSSTADSLNKETPNEKARKLNGDRCLQECGITYFRRKLTTLWIKRCLSLHGRPPWMEKTCCSETRRHEPTGWYYYSPPQEPHRSFKPHEHNSNSMYIRLHYLLTYLLTPWSRVLLEKLSGSAASQEIPHIFGTRRFLTVLTSARHLSLS